MQELDDLEFEIHKRLGDRPLLRLDKMLDRHDELMQEINELKEKLK